MKRFTILVVVLLVLFAGCARPAPTPTPMPTPIPSLTPTPNEGLGPEWYSAMEKPPRFVSGTFHLGTEGIKGPSRVEQGWEVTIGRTPLLFPTFSVANLVAITFQSDWDLVEKRGREGGAYPGICWKAEVRGGIVLGIVWMGNFNPDGGAAQRVIVATRPSIEPTGELRNQGICVICEIQGPCVTLSSPISSLEMELPIPTPSEPWSTSLQGGTLWVTYPTQRVHCNGRVVLPAEVRNDFGAEFLDVGDGFAVIHIPGREIDYTNRFKWGEQQVELSLGEKSSLFEVNYDEGNLVFRECSK